MSLAAMMRASSLLLILVLAACAPLAPPTQTPTPSPLPLRPTLPPTWTPTFTPSPAPPTQTPTPSLTPSLTPTLSPDEVCANLALSYEFKDGHLFPWGSTITMFYGSSIPDMTVRFLAVHRRSGENLGVQLPGGEIYGMQLPVERLPRSGLYDWTVSLHADSESLDGLCAHRGYFFVGEIG